MLCYIYLLFYCVDSILNIDFPDSEYRISRYSQICSKSWTVKSQNCGGYKISKLSRLPICRGISKHFHIKTRSLAIIWIFHFKENRPSLWWSAIICVIYERIIKEVVLTLTNSHKRVLVWKASLEMRSGKVSVK